MICRASPIFAAQSIHAAGFMGCARVPPEAAPKPYHSL